MRRPAALAVLAGLAVILFGALAWWRPFLTDDRVYLASIPQPAALYSAPPIDLRPGDNVCIGPVVMDTYSELASFRVGTFGRPGTPLELTITGNGYRHAARSPGGYADASLVQVPVPAPRQDTLVRICFENPGRRSVTIYGADDRTRKPTTVTRNGTEITAAPHIAFYEAKPVSIADRLPTTFARMDRFRPGFMGPWLFWPLAVLCVVGLPLGALWVLWRGVADEEEDEPAPAPVRDPDDERESTPAPV
jgi:hypothetical protein